MARHFWGGGDDQSKRMARKDATMKLNSTGHFFTPQISKFGKGFIFNKPSCLMVGNEKFGDTDVSFPAR